MPDTTEHIFVANADSVLESRRRDVLVVVKRPLPNFSYRHSSDSLGNHSVSFRDASVASQYWFWDFGNGNTSLDYSPKFRFPGQGKYPVKLRIINANGCTDSLTKIIEIKARSPLPKAEDMEVCADDWVVLKPEGGTNFNFYRTEENIELLVGTGSVFQIGTVSQSHTYIITSIDSLVESYPVKINVLISGANADFEMDPDGLELAVRDTAFFEAKSEGLAYKWDFGNGKTGSGKSTLMRYDVSGIYIIEFALTDSFGCVHRSVKTLSVRPKNEPIDNTLVLRLFPNPNTGIFSLTAEQLPSVLPPLKGVIINALGQVVHSFTEADFNQKVLSVQMPAMAAGVYLVRLRFQDKDFVKRFVIVR